MDMVRAAEAAGLDTLAITDHVEADRWGNPIVDWLDSMLREVEAIRGKAKVRLLVGIEASLLDTKGHATVTPQVYNIVDLVLCGIEWGTLGIAQNPPESKVALQRNLVTAYGNLAMNPWVDIIAHPFNLGRFPSPLRLSEIATSAVREIAAAFREGNKAFELNNTSGGGFRTSHPTKCSVITLGLLKSLPSLESNSFSAAMPTVCMGLATCGGLKGWHKSLV